MQYNDVPAILQLNPSLINVIYCPQGQATKQSHSPRWFKVPLLTFLTIHGGVLVSTIASHEQGPGFPRGFVAAA